MELVAFLLCSLVMLSGYGVRGQTKPPPPSQEYPGDYIILAPNTIHPGLPLTLSVNILNSAVGMVPVTATILKNGRETIVSASQNFNGGMSGVLTLQMPSVATNGAYSLKVSATGQQLAFDETQDLTFKREGFAILVQSDKAIYKPGQTIMFRAMAVYPDLKPYTGAFDIEMKDPDGNIVKQWMGLENTKYGVVSGEMYMSEEARLGDWVIKVTANGQEYEHVVEVSEYVLPKFEVKFILPPYATNTDAEIAGMVEAKYTYGQPVKGTATVKVTYNPGYVAWNDYGPGNQEEPPSIVRSNVKIDGTGDIRFTKSEIERAFSINLSEIYNQVVLEFNAEVTETLTGIKQEGDGSIPISKYPIQVTEVTGNPENFKPGLPYTAYVSVTHIDDSPLTKSERLKGLGVRITKDYANEQSTDNVHSIPESGIVKIGIIPEEGATNYEIKVYYLDYAPPNNNYYCGNCLSITLQDAESPSSTFLQITTESSDLATGDTATFSILTTEVPGTLQYQIVSRGDIVHTESITAGTTDTLLEFVVTAEMAPSPRLVVFYIREADGELILASINFKVSGVFENDVTISASMDKVEPGHDVSLDITAAANSFIGILAIDQSVRLLKTGNDITQDQVIQAVEEFDTTSGDNNEGPFFRGRRRREAPSRSKRSIWCPWCWNPIGGTTVREVIDNAGMLVFTNGLIHGNDNNMYHSYLEFMPVAAQPFYDEDFAADRAGPGLANEESIALDSSTESTTTRIRTEFPETWLWADYVTDANGNLQVSSKAPDTITSWVASAFGMSKTAGIGVADPTATIKVFKNFFISLNLPYSVVRGELLALQVTVFNYMSTEVTADITLVRSDGFDNVKVEKNNAVDGTSKDKNTYTYVSKDQVISAKIPANDGVTVSFPIKPKKLGMVDLTVKAESKIAADAITQPLLVKPEGVPLSSSEAVFVDLSVEAPYTKVFSYNLPSVENGLVDGSVRGVITATGDIMGPTIAGLDKLLQMPTGCGEQNMIYFAPDVFIYKYLESTNQENAEIKDKAIKFMEIGHSRELEYQHKTNSVGAFSAFGDSDESGSTWLTAFVIKSFVQASPYIYINIPKVEQALTWMLQQQKGGVFNEPGRVIHTAMQGNVNSDLTMTAYVLITLQEVIRSANISQSSRTQAQNVANMAVAHLEAQKETIKSNTYLLSLATYALTMANSAIKDELKMALDSKAKGEGGVKYWSNSDATTPANDADARREPYYNHRPPSADVEMTGYALLAYLERGTQNDFADAAGIAKWLTQQRNSYGGYSSTQDTVIGLQALSEYASQLNEGTRNINIAISSSSPDDTQELVINDANSIVYQQVELTATSGSVTVVVSGTGNCLIQFNVDYNLNKENTQNNYIFNVVVTDTDRNRVDVELCGRYKGEETQPGMGIMFGGIFSGFEAIGEDLNTMVQNEVNIARYETDAQGVTFYLNDVGQHTCATVPLQRTKPVANTQPVQASLYRYYAPDDQDVQIVTSEILARTDVCEVCGSNCNNCDDTDPGSAVKNIVNTALVMLLSALTLIIHKFM